MQDQFINYVNSTMAEVNEMTTELYESLIDGDSEATKDVVNRLIKSLRDIYKSHE
jgi:hypothetical protein